MVFKKMLSAFGVGGPSVDTVLANPNTRPGLSLDGQVNLRGGETPAGIEQVTLSLVTRVEMETGEGEHAGLMEFHRMPVRGPFQLAPGQELALPFQLPVPWETPITDLYGQRLRGMTMGLRTELSVARAVDKSDLDQVAVHPLPLHERILEALLQLGFRFKNADLERGHVHGVQQTLPFYQEIEFFASPQYAHTVNEVELTFITNQYGIDVIIECDKRGGLFSAGHDSVGRFVAQHADADRVDWTAQVDGWLSQTIASYGRHAQHGFGGGHGNGHPGHGHGHGRSGHGSGVGGMVVGGALGFAGGMLAGEMLEDAFDGDDGGFGEE
jgi:sporulation-control protein